MNTYRYTYLLLKYSYVALKPSRAMPPPQPGLFHLSSASMPSTVTSGASGARGTRAGAKKPQPKDLPLPWPLKASQLKT